MHDTDFVDRARTIFRPDAASLGSENLSITSPDAGVADQITITVLPGGMAIVQPACEDVLRPILTYQQMTFRRKGSDQVSRVGMTVSAYSVQDDRLLISHGCVPRVKQCLEQCGHHVTIVDRRAPDRHFDLATASRVVDAEGRFPGLAGRLRARREGIIEVEAGRQQSEMIAAMCQLSPQTKFLIACRTIDAAQELAENLRPYLLSEVEAVHGHNWCYSCRVVCCTFCSLDRSNPQEWDVLIFADAFDGIQETNNLVRGEYVHRRVYALVAPSRPRSQTDELLFEVLAGEVIYRGPKCRQKVQQNLSVAFVTHSSPSISVQPSPLTRHMILRTDETRNRSIAQLAMTLSSGEPTSDRNLGLNQPGTQALPNLGFRPSVVILTDSVGHGEQIQRMLPSWRLFDGCPSESLTSTELSSADPWIVPGNSIVTAVAAGRFHAYDSRILIWASGGSKPFIPQYFERLPVPCLLVDFCDHGNGQLAKETQDRLQFYRSINCCILDNDLVHQEQRLVEKIVSRSSGSHRHTSRRPRRSNRSQFDSRKKGE